jgi:hypothetical protein
VFSKFFSVEEKSAFFFPFHFSIINTFHSHFLHSSLSLFSLRYASFHFFLSFPFLFITIFLFSFLLFLIKEKRKIYKSMAEEHRCQAQRLCANNCGFFGIPAMQDLCSKCYRDLQLKEQRSSSSKLVLNQTLISQSQPSISVSETVVQQSPSPLVVDSSTLPVESVETAVVVQPNRCGTCRRRVGLTGFKCRCGMTLCGSHRYPEMHECGFDFKGMGREMIAKANPVVKGEKLNKI